MKDLFGVLIFCLISLSAAKFPSQALERCKYEDTECIKEKMNFVLHTKSDGFPELKFPKFDPFPVTLMQFIQRGENNQVLLDLKLKDLIISGLKDFEIVKVKGFGKDMAEKHSIQFKGPILGIVGGYEAEGRLLFIPLNGKGPVNATLHGFEARASWTGHPDERDGKTYMQIQNWKFAFSFERPEVLLDNLFNGDKALSDTTNQLINQNWKIIFQELREIVYDAFGKVFKNFFDYFFAQYPYDQLLIE